MAPKAPNFEGQMSVAQINPRLLFSGRVRPADDRADPLPATTFASLDATEGACVLGLLRRFKRITLRWARRTTVNAETVNSIFWQSTKTTPSWLPGLLLALVLAWSDSVSNSPAGTQIDMACPNDWAAKSLPHQLRPGAHLIFGIHQSAPKQRAVSPIDPQKGLQSCSSLLTSLTRKPRDTRGVGSGTPGRNWSPTGRERVLPGTPHCRRLAVTRVRLFPAPKDVAPNGFFRAT